MSDIDFKIVLGIIFIFAVAFIGVIIMGVIPPETVEDLEYDLSSFGDYMTWRNLAYRILNRIDLTNATGIKHTENYSGSMFGGFVAIKVGEK